MQLKTTLQTWMFSGGGNLKIFEEEDGTRTILQKDKSGSRLCRTGAGGEKKASGIQEGNKEGVAPPGWSSRKEEEEDVEPHCERENFHYFKLPSL